MKYLKKMKRVTTNANAVYAILFVVGSVTLVLVAVFS